MKIKQITENTTSGSIATVDTALGGTRSRGNPSIYGGKKVGSLFKGKKTKSQYANSVNESAELSEAHLEEEDIIVVPGQGRSRKNGFVPHGKSRVDHEVDMARSDLFSAAKNAQQVYSMIKDVGEEEGLDGWVQEKIIKANDYLNTVREYLEGKQVQGVAEGMFTKAPAIDPTIGKQINNIINRLHNHAKRTKDEYLREAVSELYIILRNTGGTYSPPGHPGVRDVAEGKRNLKCVCKTHGQDQCPVHAPIDEGSKSANKNKKA